MCCAAPSILFASGFVGSYCEDWTNEDRYNDPYYNDPSDLAWGPSWEDRDYYGVNDGSDWALYMSPEENEEAATFAFCFPDLAEGPGLTARDLRINRDPRKPHVPNIKDGKGMCRKCRGYYLGSKRVNQRHTRRLRREEDRREAQAA